MHIPENYAGNQFTFTESPEATVDAQEEPQDTGQEEALFSSDFSPLPEEEKSETAEEEPVEVPVQEASAGEASAQKATPLSLLPGQISPDMLILLLVFLLGGEEGAAELPTLLLFLLLL